VQKLAFGEPADHPIETLGQSAVRKEGWQKSAPLPLDGKENERGRSRASDDRDTEDGAKRRCR
jgi:hypothetical protein